MPKQVLDPVSRIEGHLRVEIDTTGVTGAPSTVNAASAMCEMFRGYENILVGHDPVDAVQITQRI